MLNYVTSTGLYVNCDRLDPALIRPGRVDHKEKIDYASHYQLCEMFRRFYPEQSPNKAMLFADAAIAMNNKISMAQIQGLFMMHKSEPDAVIKHIEKLTKL